MCGRGSAHAGGIKSKSANFAGVAVSGDFFSVQQKADTSRVANFYDDFVTGANRRIGGSDESLLRCRLAVGRDRDPGRLVGTDQQSEAERRLGSGRERVGFCHRRIDVGIRRVRGWLGGGRSRRRSVFGGQCGGNGGRRSGRKGRERSGRDRGGGCRTGMRRGRRLASGCDLAVTAEAPDDKRQSNQQ